MGSQDQVERISYEEPTWEPLANLHEDISDMLQKFLDDYPDVPRLPKLLAT